MKSTFVFETFFKKCLRGTFKNMLSKVLFIQVRNKEEEIHKSPKSIFYFKVSCLNNSLIVERICVLRP